MNPQFSSYLGSALLNITMIVSLVLLVPTWGIKALGWGILVGGALQCLAQVMSFARIGAQFVQTSWFHPGVQRILKLLGPRLLGTAVYQISVFVDTIIASFYWIVGDGGQSALYYSSRLFQLPLAIFGVALAQAALPTLSGHAAEKKMDHFRHSLDFTLRNVIFASLPAAIGLAIFAKQIVIVLLKRGEFGDYSVMITSQALLFYSLGLVSCGVIKVLVTAFYALQDTKTPVKTASIGLIVNVVLNLAFMWHLKIAGLALATSLAATLNAVLLFVILWRRIDLKQCSKVGETLLKSFVACCVMGVACGFVFLPWIDRAVASVGKFAGIGELSISIGLSILIYFGIALALKSEEAEKAKHFFSPAK